MSVLEANRPLLSELNKDYALYLREFCVGNLETLADLLMSKDIDKIIGGLSEDDFWRMGNYVEISYFNIPLFLGNKGFAGILKGIKKGKWTRKDVLNDISQLNGIIFVDDSIDDKITHDKMKKNAKSWEQKLLRYCANVA